MYVMDNCQYFIHRPTVPLVEAEKFVLVGCGHFPEVCHDGLAPVGNRGLSL